MSQTLITAEELRPLLSQPHIVLLDCRYYLMEPDRGRQEYMQSHIPGAYYMDTLLDLSSPVIKGVTGRHPLPHPEVFAFTMRNCGVHPDTQIIVYDQQGGVYASRAWWLLQWLGHARVAVLDGGFMHWYASGFESDNQWPPPKPGTFTIQLHSHLAVSMDEVARNTHPLIDSREFKRYTGETEPIDPVAGHIPGAICMPYMDNVDERGFWKSSSWLKEKFSGIPYDPATPPVFYCGSGVTACHNILAYKIATGHDALLYGGSFSEWIHYHPVATGTTAR